MEALILRAKGLGKHVMVAAIEAGNAGSIRLHEKLGFQQVGHLNEVGARFVAEAFLRFLAGLDREGAGLDESRPPDTLPNTTSLAP